MFVVVWFLVYIHSYNCMLCMIVVCYVVQCFLGYSNVLFVLYEFCVFFQIIRCNLYKIFLV